MSDTETGLTVIEQREVAFYDDELTAVRASDTHIYVSVRHMCDALGLDRPSLVRRIKRTEVLADGYKGGVKLTSPGGEQRAGMLRVDLVPLLLTGVRVKSVKPEIQDRLKQYQREAAKVLWEAFQEGRLTTQPEFDTLLLTDSPAVQTYKMMQAMTQLARSQVLMEARLSGRIEDHEERLERIESELGDPGRRVTPEQASQISQAVKAIAVVLSKKTGRNEYGGIYGEFYRRFGITSYKELPAKRFDEAMGFLTEWHQELVGDSPF